MSIHIPSDFSVYALLQRVRQVSIATNRRRTMNLISNEIENATLVDGAPSRLFAGFQRASRFLPQMARYRKLAQKAESVYVFAVMDIDLPPISNITYVPLQSSDQLAREWFVVAFCQDFASALATAEQSHIDDPDDDRRFTGLWTFSLPMVAILEEWLTNTVNASEMHISERDFNLEYQATLIKSIKTRLRGQLDADVLDSDMSAELEHMMAVAGISAA